MQAFEEVKRVTIFNDKSLTSELAKVKDTLEKTSNDWKVRIDALQMMRALLIARADQYDDFYQYLKQLELPFQSSLKDLRSQVNWRAFLLLVRPSPSGSKRDPFWSADCEGSLHHGGLHVAAAEAQAGPVFGSPPPEHRQLDPQFGQGHVDIGHRLHAVHHLQHIQRQVHPYPDGESNQQVQGDPAPLLRVYSTAAAYLALPRNGEACRYPAGGH